MASSERLASAQRNAKTRATWVYRLPAPISELRKELKRLLDNNPKVGKKSLRAAGDQYEAKHNLSHQLTSGTFANLPDNFIFSANGNNFQADYEAGDGKDLTLAVVQ